MSEISSEYAKALFMLACEKECAGEYKTALETVEGVFKENPLYLDFLYAFTVPLEERLNALESAFSNEIPRDVLSFLKILCEKKHIMEFSECAYLYYELYNETDKISMVKVTSAVELSQDEKARLEEKLRKTSGKTVVAEYVVDKSIIGGLVVEADGRVIDSSIRKHLKEVKDVIRR